MYDFYMLSLLKNSGDPDIESAVQHARETLLPTLRKNMLDALFFAICAELRHAWRNSYEKDAGSPYSGGIRGSGIRELLGDLWPIFNKFHNVASSGENDPKPIRGKYKGERLAYVAAAKAAEATGAKKWQIVKIARKLFGGRDWITNYGGEAWEAIARAWEKLSSAKDLNQMEVWIDHAYDLQHNNDTVLNKMRQYYKQGYGWIARALDFKAIADPQELQHKVSQGMKRLAGFALYAKYGTTLQASEEKRKKEFEDKTFEQMSISGKRISPEDVKTFAKKMHENQYTDGVADLYVKYDLEPVSAAQLAEDLQKKKGIRIPHRLRTNEVYDEVNKRAKRLVYKHYDELSDLYERYASNIIFQIRQEFVVGELFAGWVDRVYRTTRNKTNYTYCQDAKEIKHWDAGWSVHVCVPTKTSPRISFPLEFQISRDTWDEIIKLIGLRDYFAAREKLQTYFQYTDNQVLDAIMQYITKLAKSGGASLDPPPPIPM
jgi:hypothetical protein